MNFKLFESVYLSSSEIFEKLYNINNNFINPKEIGKGDHGIAYLCDNKIVKITDDSCEAEFANAIKGETLEHIAHIYDVYQYEDLYVIIREYLPHNFNDYDYTSALYYFDNYIEKNKSTFNFTYADFQKMISDFKASNMEYDDYDEDSDYELEYLNFIIDTHLELNKFNILSTSDMKSQNMGYSDMDLKYYDLHIWKINSNYIEKEFKQL
jgi:hypothetical protein